MYGYPNLLLQCLVLPPNIHYTVDHAYTTTPSLPKPILAIAAPKAAISIPVSLSTLAAVAVRLAAKSAGRPTEAEEDVAEAVAGALTS